MSLLRGSRSRRREGRPAGSYVRPRRRIRLLVQLLRLAFTPAPRRYKAELDDAVRTYARFDEIPPEVVRAVAEAYVRVFDEPPWTHRLRPEDVARKLAHDLGAPRAWLTVMWGADPGTVAGFCWGAVIPTSEVPRRVIAGSGLPPAAEPRLRALVEERVRAEQVVYVDEIALLRRARGPMRSVEGFIRISVPLLETAASERSGIFGWTLRSAAALTLLNRLFLFHVLDVIGPVCIVWLDPGASRDLAVLSTRLGFRRIFRIGRVTSRGHEVVH